MRDDDQFSPEDEGPGGALGDFGLLTYGKVIDLFVSPEPPEYAKGGSEHTGPPSISMEQVHPGHWQLFSYRMLIAKRWGNAVWITRADSTRTTNRHISTARGAVHRAGLQVLESDPAEMEGGLEVMRDSLLDQGYTLDGHRALGAVSDRSLEAWRSRYVWFRAKRVGGFDPAPFDKEVEAWGRKHFGVRKLDPEQWCIAAQSAPITCQACGGTGVYDHPGAPNSSGGPCYRCHGKGWQDWADAMRNAAYDKHRRQQAQARDEEATQEREGRGRGRGGSMAGLFHDARGDGFEVEVVNPNSGKIQLAVFDLEGEHAMRVWESWPESLAQARAGATRLTLRGPMTIHLKLSGDWFLHFLVEIWHFYNDHGINGSRSPRDDTTDLSPATLHYVARPLDLREDLQAGRPTLVAGAEGRPSYGTGLIELRGSVVEELQVWLDQIEEGTFGPGSR